MNIEDRRERDNIKNHSEAIINTLYKSLLDEGKDYFERSHSLLDKKRRNKSLGRTWEIVKKLLSDKEFKVFYLYYKEGFSQNDIAKTLNWNQAYICFILQDAVRKMQLFVNLYVKKLKEDFMVGKIFNFKFEKKVDMIDNLEVEHIYFDCPICKKQTGTDLVIYEPTDCYEGNEFFCEECTSCFIIRDNSRIELMELGNLAELVKHNLGDIKKLFDDLVEELSNLEHQQWVFWSKQIAVKENISADRLKEWEKSWVTWKKLPENLKRKDRVWSKRVVAILKKYVSLEILNGM